MLAENRVGFRQPLAHCTVGNVQRSGNVFLLHVLVVAQQDDLPVPGRQIADSVDDRVVGESEIHRMGKRVRFHPLVHMADPGGTAVVPADVDGNARQPGEGFCLATELVKMPEGLHERVLDGVLREGRIPEGQRA